MVCLLSNNRLAITALILDTGISCPPDTGTPAVAGAPAVAAAAGAPERSLDVIPPNKPVPFRPFNVK